MADNRLKTPLDQVFPEKRGSLNLNDVARKARQSSLFDELYNASELVQRINTPALGNNDAFTEVAFVAPRAMELIGVRAGRRGAATSNPVFRVRKNNTTSMIASAPVGWDALTGTGAMTELDAVDLTTTPANLLLAEGDHVTVTAEAGASDALAIGGTLILTFKPIVDQ